MPTPGTLIVFEGPEGVGKTTQLRLLADRFDARADGPEVLTVREPGGTRVGDAIREALLDPSGTIVPWTEALLFMASRAQLVEEVIRPALSRGATVLLDRFFLSTYAYQVRGRGLDQTSVVETNRLATGGLVPSLTILLCLDGGEGLARAARRGAHDRIEGAESAFHERVSAAFADFVGPAWQAAHPECGPIVAVDASGSPDAVSERVRRALDVRWPQLAATPARSEAVT